MKLDSTVTLVKIKEEKRKDSIFSTQRVINSKKIYPLLQILDTHCQWVGVEREESEIKNDDWGNIAAGASPQAKWGKM